ncbi:MAG: putative nicotinate-nucleotide adenylyltransferase [Cyanobacteria bacterium RYN_339]|nr:putative nicotinate-nucleotide adenylyltransferase [Cyanobacteria bacterium RYN_339]
MALTADTDWRLSIGDWMRERLSPHRYQHVLGVAATARELAVRYGADPDKAELAGLLHDAAREWRPPQLLASAREWGLHVGYLEELAPMPSLHAPLGAEVARREFGVEDPEVLSAIAHHTLGAEDMTVLDKVLFLADGIEPGRGDADHLRDVRQASRTDLDRACRLSLDHTFTYLLRSGQVLHPRSVQARNWLICQEKARTTQAKDD